ncbi:hypothetical protein Poli38472_014606 [Pythium oligandrum]|uniref:Uncharacterized protein n=1 Tax=Pythium oligandrum TaxID=41045 RepID=A0A8K1FK10_PYTOL|nr:hypothetical protein Poli38472_014606 [Pythium oligandrum]|eukprot:TMW66630.1 hypothetical protein Poli38472_014606 [Pythium oligandrum]
MQMRAIVVPRGSEGDFDDSRLSYVNVDRQYKFTLVDGRGYVTVENAETGKLINTDCLPVRAHDTRVIDPEGPTTTSPSCATRARSSNSCSPFIFCTKDDTAEDDLKIIRGCDLTATLNFLRDNADKVESGVSLAAPSYVDISKCEVLDCDDNNDDEDNQTRSLLLRTRWPT